MMGPLTSLLSRRRLVVIDGGLATELERRGHDLDDPLWSARVLLDDPEAIAAVHGDYLDAGADVITTASYQASHPGLRARGLSDDQADAVLVRSVELAQRAIDSRGSHAIVAASIGCYGASLADGSEYRGDYGLSVAALAAFHHRRAQVLAAHARLLACETVPCLAEAQALAIVLGQVLPQHPGAEAWVALSCRDDARVCHGEPIEACVQALAEVPGVVAIGVNCTAPRHVRRLVQRVAAVAGDKAVIAYPNAGETWNAGVHTWHGDAATPPELSALARGFVDAGARILGGCCRTTPAHIAALARLRDGLSAADRC